MINRDSPAAKTLPDKEVDKRERFYREKMEKLKNPNYFISKTRLSVRNLPKTITERELKKIFIDAAKSEQKEEKVRLKQVWGISGVLKVEFFLQV